jgi:hypothetical protein
MIINGIDIVLSFKARAVPSANVVINFDDQLK